MPKARSNPGRARAPAKAAGAKKASTPAARLAPGRGDAVRAASAPRPRKPPATRAPYRARLDRLAALLPAAGATHLLVTNPKDVGYLTGFLGGDSYLLVPAAGAGGRPVIISDFRYQEELEPVRSLADVFIRRRSIIEAVTEVTGSMGPSVGAVGIQSEHLTVALRGAVARAVGEARVRDTTGLVGNLRAVKDDHEISLIRAAAKIQEDALRAVLPAIRPGQTELEVAARLESEMKVRGSSQPGFQTIVAAAAHGSLPHYRPGGASLAAGKPVLIDWGAVFLGYHADMTRCFSLGPWKPKMREVYTVVLEAHELAAAALAPGRTTAQIDAVARDHIGACGYGEYFGHGLGHGLGLDGHEEPRLTNMLSPTVLEPGMVVTIEPGIYLPGAGGVRIEDDYVITQRGARNLCTLPRDLNWATL